MMSRNRARKIAPLSLLLALSGCWLPNAEDAGDEAFVIDAMKRVAGRAPASVDEVRALADISDDLGRQAVLDVIMSDPEYLDYWSVVLMDDLLVWRNGGDRPDNTSCFTETMLPSSHYADLVEHLRFEFWYTEFCPDLDIDDIQFGTKSSSDSTDRTTTLTSTSSASKDTESKTTESKTTETKGTESDKLIDVDAPDDRDRGEIARDDELDRLAAADDRDGLRLAFESEAVAPRERVLGAMAPLEHSMIEISAGLDDDAGAQPFVVDFDFKVETCESFTMADALNASLSEDRLDVLYRAAIAPLGTFHAGGNNPDNRAAASFFDAYTDRDPACVQCHSTNYSTTNPSPRNDDWDRFEAATWVDLEAAAFSWTDGGGYHDGAMGGTEVLRRVIRLNREDQWSEEGGLRPFGMAGSCFQEGDRLGFLPPETLSAQSSDAGIAGLDGNQLGLLALTDQFGRGMYYLNWSDTAPADVPTLDGGSGDAGVGGDMFNDSCLAGCHSNGGAGQDHAPKNLLEHMSQMPPARIFDIVANGSPAQEMGGLGDAIAADVTEYVITHPDYQHQMVYDDASTALAHLTAMKIVDNVFNELTMQHLVTETGFPRNPEAAETLDHLTRVFVDNGWSLKALLSEIILSSHANRVAPEDSFQDPYPLPMVVNPYADVNSNSPNTDAGEDANGNGDLVYRYSVTSLLSQVHHALLWPAPPRFPSSSGYANLSFQEEVGAQLNNGVRGFPEVVLPALLAWEDEIGRCDNPTGDDDFIDLVTDPALGLTLGEAMLAVKERLLTYPIWFGEPGANGGVVWGGGGPVGEIGHAAELTHLTLDDLAEDDPDAVRDYCAALLQSPDFLFGGTPVVPDGEALPDGPDGAPCVDEDRCTEEDHCEYYKGVAEDLGYNPGSCTPWNDTLDFG